MTTSAKKLIELIERMIVASKSTNFNNKQASLHRLVESVGPISEAMAIAGSQELTQQLLALTSIVKNDIEHAPNIDGRSKTRFKAAVNKIEDVFEASNYLRETRVVFNRHFSEENMDALHWIDERLNREGQSIASIESLKSSLADLDNAFKSFCETDGVNDNIKQTIRSHIKSLRDTIEYYDIYGEDDFWDKYAIVLTNMTASLPDMDAKDRAEMQNHFVRVFENWRGAMGLTSDLTSIANNIVQMLPKA